LPLAASLSYRKLARYRKAEVTLPKLLLLTSLLAQAACSPPIKSAKQVPTLAPPIAPRNVLVSWTANAETAVNSAGGGYYVYYSNTSGFLVPSSGTAHPHGALIVKNSMLLAITTAFSLIFFSGAGSANLPWATTSRVQNYVPGEVLVKLAPHSRITGQTAFQAFAARIGIDQAADLRESGLLKMKLSAGQSVEDSIAQLSQDPEVESA
jgi:hypothetical protein